jgi:hypothetical protein
VTEFEDHFVKQLHGGDPDNVAMVIAAARSGLRARRMDASTRRWTNFKTLPRRVKAFVKGEPNRKRPNRVITNYGTEYSTMYASFIAPLERLMKGTKWYAFSKTPVEVAEGS